MKKQFFIPACVLIIAAIVFVVFALNHPELSFPWSVQLTHIIYGIYIDVIVLLIVMAFRKNAKMLYPFILASELGGVFFLVQSILTVIPQGESNLYLPIALAFNIVAIILIVVQRKMDRSDAE